MDRYLEKYSDAREKQYLNSLRDGIVIVDTHNHIEFINISALNLLGYTEEKIIGKKFEDIVQLQINGSAVSEEQSPLHKARKKNGVYSSDSEKSEQLTMARGDRSMLSVRLTVIPSRETESSSTSMVVFHDSTADEKIDRAKSEFIALVSHQLRTPINIISWYVEKLLNERHGDLNSHQKDYLHEVVRSNQRVTELVQAIVNVSRTDLSRLKHKHEKVMLDEILTKISSEIAGLAQEKNLEYRLHIHKKSLILKDSDQELVAVSIRNVIQNSIRYTQSGGHILVTTEDAEKKKQFNGYVFPADGYIVTVEDNGIGIPDEEKQSVFTKLFRASNVQALDVTGVGLGLYIAQNFVQELGGHIWFDSELRNGSTFYIYIPRE